MLDSDGEIEGETHQERHAATLALAMVCNLLFVMWLLRILFWYVGPIWVFFYRKLTNFELWYSQRRMKDKIWRKIKGDRDRGRD